MAKNTYKQDEVLEEPFDIKHLLRASSYIKKYAKRMVFAILLSGIGGASGYVAPMVIQRALDLAIPEKNERLLFSLVGMLVGIYLVSVIFTTIRSRIMVDVSQSSSMISEKICLHICRSCRSSITMTARTARS